MYCQFCDRKGFDPHQQITSLEDIPAVAVSVFKELGFKLNSVPKEDLTMALQSSATSGIPSTVVLDKITAKRQGKATVKVISEFIGAKRIPFLIMDIDPRGADRRLLGARFAAVTGYLKFASKVGYFLKAKDGISYFDVGGIIWGSDTMSWSILLSDEGPSEWCKPVYSRVLMVHEVNHIDEALAHIEDFIQTIDIAAPEDKAIAFANAASAKGTA